MASARSDERQDEEQDDEAPATVTDGAPTAHDRVGNEHAKDDDQ
jgi:hypothetical protein